MFFLAYHLHWSYCDIMAIDMLERRKYVRMLMEQIENENEAHKRASQRSAR